MPRLALLTAHGGPIELAEFPLTTPAPGTAALRLRMAGICGSDLHIFRGELPLPCPFAMGHEMVGEIAELGEGLTSDATGKPLAVGDRVVAPYFWFCGSCHACARGRSYACQNLMAGEYRTHDQAPHFVAAYGEYYYTSRRQPLYKVPAELPDAAVAPLNCALAQVLFALRDVRLGDTVVIQGAGGLGINAAAVARTAGAAAVVVIDKIAERLHVAADFGATHCIDASGISAAEVTERVREHTGGIGADWVLEVVGVPGVIPEGIGFLNNGGTLLEVGNVGMGRTFELDPSALVYGNKSVRGVMLYDPVTLATGLSFLQHTSFPFERLMPKPFRLTDVNEAFASADAGLVPRGALIP
ncbi:zinc-binding alcohol dehydrogenase [Mycobacterium mantenii]|uniref:L-threonine 3-dehydrogenase n=1 Tax=Mycobacterium mantenii TaxID=560555 RepID=A0A1X0FV48_MYCNT|nr:zinc-binding dehydrogenase [Mycobacterium mantenii]MCV7246398.1 zinc-binding dehydrogenase [Mycobacterium mantenii]ORB05653.1 L-threonine 3-dehydrogenase [Mycobacterium mantenii]BBY38628.1 zinc-binding alcohol dehydrogenase [Mycobacterium mantenii]